MASLTLTVPNAVIPRITAAIGYSSTLPNGDPNPVTPAEAIKSFLINSVKAQVKQFENPTAAFTAIVANDQNINSSIIIT